MITEPNLKFTATDPEQKVSKQAKPKLIKQLKSAAKRDTKKAAQKKTQENTQQSAVSENFQISSLTRNESDQPEKISDKVAAQNATQGKYVELEIIQQCNIEEENEYTVTEPPTTH